MQILDSLCADGLPSLDSATYFIGSLRVPNGVTKDNPYQWVQRVQPFDSGGWEVYVHRQDLGKIHRRCDDMAPVRGPRLAPNGPPNDESRLRAVQRARREVRLIARNLGVDRLMTLTTRQDENTIEDLLARFAKLRRLYREETGQEFHYVAVPEPHPSNPGHFHLHLGVSGFVRLEVMRRHWWDVCGGRGMGNVDIQCRAGLTNGTANCVRIASYIAKYIGKGMVERFNKKRYWASRITLPPQARVVLGGVENDAVSAFAEMRRLMGLENDSVMASIAANDGVWFRPDGLGFWLSWHPEWGSLDPAPF